MKPRRQIPYAENPHRPISKAEMRNIRTAFNKFNARHGEPTARQFFKATVITKET